MARAQLAAGAPVAAAYPHLAAAPRDDAAVRAAAGNPIALFSCSLSGTVLAAGAVLSGLSGRPLSELSGAPAHALLHPSSSAQLQRVLRAARGGAEFGSETLRLRHAGGSDIAVRTSWSVLAGASRESTQLVFVSAMDPLGRPDTAVHAATSAGRGRVHLCDQTLGEDTAHRYSLAADLRAALADNALRLEYQPIVDLRSGNVVGMEALARWTHPERGPVPPCSFVSVAELTDLVPELDRWVVQRALRDMAALRTAGVVPDDAYLTVNLSARNLTDTFDFDELLSWTEESGLPATQLVLEITETAIMQNTELAVELLRRLREQGFGVAMDDFGTGYSSLAYLRDLPISALKIDRSFVADITQQQDALAIIASIVDLAGAVGIAVIAEGVETAEQAELLRRLGCVTAQGWLWSPAVPVTALLRGREWMSPLGGAGGLTAMPRTTGRGERDVSVTHGFTRLLELHRDGASVGTIAAALNAEGLRTPAGRRWNRTSVARVIAQRIRRCAGRSAVGRGGRRTTATVLPTGRAHEPPGVRRSDLVGLSDTLSR